MDNYQRDRAKSVLALADAVAMGSGTISEESQREEIFGNYKRASESPKLRERKEKKEKQSNVPWTMALFM